MVNNSKTKSIGISCLICLLFLVLLLIVAIPVFLNYAFAYHGAPILDAVQDGDFAKVKTSVKKEPKMVNYSYLGYGEEYTVLTSALYYKHFDIAKYLLEKGANPNKGTMDGSPLHFAAEKGDEELVRCLFKHGAIIEKGDSYLNIAIENKNWRVCRVFRHYGANDVPMAFEAAARGDIELVKEELVKHPAVLKMKVDQGRNIVHFAVQSNEPEIVRMLAKSGADINSASEEYSIESPVASACYESDLATVKALVEYGANLGWSDDNIGEDCLTYAVKGLHIDVVRYLLEKGLLPNKNRASVTYHLMQPGYNIDGSINAKSELKAMKIARLLISKGFVPHKETLKEIGFGICKTADYLRQYAR